MILMTFMAGVGAIQAGIGIWQAIKASRDQAEIDKIKPTSVPDELYQNKNLVKNQYAELGSERSFQEAQARDLAKAREAQNAGMNLSPAGRLQADVASNVNTGIDLAAIYQDYRKAYRDIVKDEMQANIDIASSKLNVDQLNLDLASKKTEMYIMRQQAWADLINAGIGNAAGAVQSKYNERYMNKLQGGDYRANLDKQATAIWTNPKDPNYLEFQDALNAGNYDRAARLLKRAKR